jgi:hypothetical protein
MRMSNYDYESLLMEALSNRQQRRQLVRRLNAALPDGRNRWFHLQKKAKRAAHTTARQMTQRTGRPFAVQHHVYQPLGLRHYHLVTPDGRALRLRFLYFEIVPGEIDDDGGAYGESYTTARQTFLRGLLDDLNQPGYIKGWIRQELNRLDRVSQARQTGQRLPGGSKRRLRGVPGFDVGHRVPGLHNPANFRVEHASTNRARPSIARRIGVKRWR